MIKWLVLLVMASVVFLLIFRSEAHSCSLAIPPQHSIKVIKDGWKGNYGQVLQREYDVCGYQVKLSNAWQGEDIVVVLDKDAIVGVEE